MDPTRVANEIVQILSQLSAWAAYGSIIGILVICGLGIPIPEDITLLAAGLLASSGSITLPGAIIAGFVGVFLGDGFLFFMGRWYGKKIFALPGFRSIFTPERVLSAEKRIRRNGPFICFIARFLPGLRSPVFAMSGALGVRPLTFFLLDGFAALISVPVWVYLGYWFGSNLEDALHVAKRLQIYIFGGLAAVIIGYFVYKFISRKRNAKRVALEAELARSVAPDVTQLEDRK